MTGTSESERLALQLLTTVYCCRAWEISPLHPVGTCGICGQIPKAKNGDDE